MQPNNKQWCNKSYLHNVLIQACNTDSITDRLISALDKNKTFVCIVFLFYFITSFVKLGMKLSWLFSVCDNRSVVITAKQSWPSTGKY